MTKPTLLLALCTLLIVVLNSILFPSTTQATEPFPDEIIYKENGKWQCPKGEYCGYFLVLFDRDTQKERRLSIEELFPNEKDYQTYVNISTAGPIWSDYAFPFLIKLDGHDYLCTSFWTGKRHLINLDMGKVEDPKRFAKELDKAEKQRIRSIIKNAATQFSKGETTLDYSYGSELEGAMLLAIRLGMKDIREDLETINQYGIERAQYSNHQGRYTKGMKPSLIPSDSLAFNIKAMSDRRNAQVALRRLGFQPKDYPIIFFEDKELMTVTPTEKRQEALSQVKRGWSAQKVYEFVGTPDYMEIFRETPKKPGQIGPGLNWDHVWRYDFSGKNDYSLLLSWDDDGNVKQIKKVTPGLWHGDELLSEKNIPHIFRFDGSLYHNPFDSGLFLGKVEVLFPEE